MPRWHGFQPTGRVADEALGPGPDHRSEARHFDREITVRRAIDAVPGVRVHPEQPRHLATIERDVNAGPSPAPSGRMSARTYTSLRRLPSR